MWTSILPPPLTVLLSIVVIIISRLWTGYARARVARIKALNNLLQAASGLEPVE